MQRLLIAIVPLAVVLGVSVAGLTLPSGWARVDAAHQAAASKPKINMIAVGDSYSAGVGVGPVRSGCDQDWIAYGPRARLDILPKSHRITGFAFVACSGHKTGDLWSQQLPEVRSSHTVASVTIGGNDIGFGPKLSGCYFGRCGPDVFSLQADVRGGEQTWDQLHDKLYTTYVKIRRRMSSGGHLYVLTYPIPFSRDGARCNGLDATEQNAANALVTRLDDTIYHAVQRANKLLPSVHKRPGNVHFVDWRTGTRIDGGYTIPKGYSGSGSRFATFKSPDGLCNSKKRTPFINGYTPTTKNNSFHPNSTGYWKGAKLFAAAVRKYHGAPKSPPATPNPEPNPSPETSPESGATWILSNTLGGDQDRSFGYGRSTDIPVFGDWNGDGIDTHGVFRPSTATWILSNTLGGDQDRSFGYGRSTDIPVFGDWNGDGIDTHGVFRPSTATWILSNTLGGDQDRSFGYGRSTDIPVFGDWNGDGIDTHGVFRPSTATWILSNTLGGDQDRSFGYGRSTDIPVFGDWNGDGIDTHGVFRPSTATWILSNTLGGDQDRSFGYGRSTDIPVFGDWNGDGIVTHGVKR